MTDDLFTPTVQRPRASWKPPWRPDSIVYPAFFGGPLTATVLGLVNGRRLGIAAWHLAAIAGAGVVALFARLVVAAATEGNFPVRLAGSIAGVLVWVVIAAVQRRPFRAFTYRGGDAASLVGPGIAAVIGLGLLEAVLLVGLLP